MKRKVIIYILKWYSNWLWLCCHLYLALWATRQTEETKGNRELHVKTTLRELIIYLVFLIILCVGKRDKRYHRHCMYQEKKPTQTNKKTIYLHKMKHLWYCPLHWSLMFYSWNHWLFYWFFVPGKEAYAYSMSLAHQSSNYQYTWNIDLCSLVCIALSIGILLQNYLCWYNQV